MAVAATGFFDGVHRGHAKVIETLLSEARKRGEESLVLTFWPHPRMVLQDEARSLRLLTSLDEKRRLLTSMGVDRVEVLPFSREFAANTAGQYLRDTVRDRFGAGTVVLGYNNRLGNDNLRPEASAVLARSLGINPVICGPLEDGRISSTDIRRILSFGDVGEAASMLGRPYTLTGVVVAGNRLGRTIGYPTANMQLYEPLKILPGVGVYLTEVSVLGREYHGMTNIGTRPTVGNWNAITIETNIFDFDENIYGLDLTLRFLHRIRSEQRFDSLDMLRSRLEADERTCRKLVGNQ